MFYTDFAADRWLLLRFRRLRIYRLERCVTRQMTRSLLWRVLRVFEPSIPVSMEFTPDDLKRIARLARIAVTDDEGTNFANQLGGVFGLIEQLQAVDTRGVEPLAHPLDVIEHHAQRLRDDVAIELDRREANMANAPARENGLFLVPKVLE